MVKLFVGNTDNDWFDLLSRLDGLEEVNFWKPTASGFNAIGEGERFIFRLKSPRNLIGGFGTLAESSVLPIQTAWEAFGIKNGVPSLGALVDIIARYRRDETVTPSTFIGCRILVQPVFLSREQWFAVPSWSNSIVQGKSYSGDSEEGIALWRALEVRAAAQRDFQFQGVAEGEGPRFGEPVAVIPRLGQGAFRVAITELYHRQCALSGGRVLPALDAAHIRPYSEGGAHSKNNGILLRKDIHSVFDAGYATIDENYRFLVSNRVKEVFNNGHEYRKLHGALMKLPDSPADRPDRLALKWHNENRYLG